MHPLFHGYLCVYWCFHDCKPSKLLDELITIIWERERRERCTSSATAARTLRVFFRVMFEQRERERERERERQSRTELNIYLSNILCVSLYSRKEMFRLSFHFRRKTKSGTGHPQNEPSFSLPYSLRVYLIATPCITHYLRHTISLFPYRCHTSPSFSPPSLTKSCSRTSLKRAKYHFKGSRKKEGLLHRNF